MNQQVLKQKLLEVYKESFNWDFDGTASVSNENREFSVDKFEQEINKIFYGMTESETKYCVCPFFLQPIIATHICQHCKKPLKPIRI